MGQYLPGVMRSPFLSIYRVTLASLQSAGITPNFRDLKTVVRCSGELKIGSSRSLRRAPRLTHKNKKKVFLFIYFCILNESRSAHYHKIFGRLRVLLFGAHIYKESLRVSSALYILNPPLVRLRGHLNTDLTHQPRLEFIWTTGLVCV